MKTENITVTYDDHMGTDMTVCNAARQSFGKLKPRDQPLDASDRSLLQYLATGKRTKEWDALLDEVVELAVATKTHYPLVNGEVIIRPNDVERNALKQRLIAFKREPQHWVPFGHPQISLRLRIPIFLARQYAKHQVGGVWSEESRRYMDEEPSFYFEPVWKSRPDDVKQGADGELPDQAAIDNYMRVITGRQLDDYMALVKVKKQGFTMAPEQARQILTQNTMVGFTWTGSLVFWARLYTQRIDKHAQDAAQEGARQVDAIVAPLFPEAWKALTK